MRPPRFWDRDAGGRDAAPLLRLLTLAPSGLYTLAAAAALRLAKPERAPIPVVCVGNVSVGGVGKTPIARAIRNRLEALGAPTATLSRGHGGRLKGPLRVDPARHRFNDVGDEPLLHAQDGPAFIARRRIEGARLAAQGGAKAIVMDDGFQHHGIVKDLSLLVFDAVAGIANGRVLPAGPLREPLHAALARADAAILVGQAGLPPDWLKGFTRPVLAASIAPASAPPPGPLVAFAGIGRPEKFFDTLSALGAEVVDALPFPDHHPFTAADLKLLQTLAKERGARLITTEKDLMRLPAALRGRIATLPVTARFDDEAALEALLAPIARAALGS